MEIERLLLQVSASEFQEAGKELGIDIKLWHIIVAIIILGIMYKVIVRQIRVNKWRLKKMKAIANTDFRDYLPYKKKSLYIPAMCQSKTPSDYPDPIDATIAETRENLLNKMIELMKDNNGCNNLYCILAGAGMGKSSFMVYLYRKMVYQMDGTGHDIEILSLIQSDVIDKINRIEDKGNVILLLDALDENVEAMKNFDDFWNKLLFAIKDFNRVIITCRTQFFSSSDKEPNYTTISSFSSEKGVKAFIRFYISPFKDKERILYIKKKYSWFHPQKRIKALKMIELNDSLMSRPLLLSNIDDLINSKDRYKYGFQIYQALIKSWLEREARRQKLYGADKLKFISQIPLISKAAAFTLYKNLNNNPSCTMTKEQLEAFEDLHPLHNAELRLNSLFNRDVKGNWKFSHKSFFEYFLSEIAFENWDDIPNLDKFDMAIDFYKQRCLDEFESNLNTHSFWSLHTNKLFNELSINKVPIGFHPMHLIPVLNEKRISSLSVSIGDLITPQFILALNKTPVEIVEISILHSDIVPTDILQSSNLLMMVIHCSEEMSPKHIKSAARVGFLYYRKDNTSVFYKRSRKAFSNPYVMMYYPTKLDFDIDIKFFLRTGSVKLIKD